MESRNKLGMCRLCLCQYECFVNIFELNDWHGYVAAKVISDLLHLQVSETDGYPHVVCSTCLAKLTDFKLFKECCQKSKVAFDDMFVSSESPEEHKPEMEISDLDAIDVDDIKEEPVEVHVSLLDTGTNPQYLQTLECKRSPCESIVTADADPCTHNISTDDESVFEISENNSLSVEFEASSNGKMKRSEGQWIQQGELSYMTPSLQENFGNGRKRARQDKGTGDGEEGLGATAPWRKFEGRNENLECYHCGKVLKTKHCLIQHMKSHGFDNSCDCEICVNVIQSKVNLKCQDLAHACPKSHICAECSKSFSRRCDLKVHIRSHTGTKPYVCAECSKCFSQSSNLKTHMRRHTGSKPYTCSECSKSFSQSSSLKTHMRIHTGSKPYTCSECNKSFSQSSNFITHMRIHTGSKPYTCSECSKSFSQSSNLITHMRTHTDSKPYKCTECSQGFSRSNSLKVHMMSHAGQT